MADIGVGYITDYNPSKATVSVRTSSGVDFVDQPFDSSLGLYTTPVLPIKKGTAGSDERVVHTGSYVLYAAIDDANIRIIRLFNDDPQTIANTPGRSKYRGDVQDSLLYMLQQGETLVTAPGKLELRSTGKYSRTPGGWMLFRNGGDVYLSNANTSAQLWLKDSGILDIKSTAFSILGTLTSLVEQSDGTFALSSGRDAQAGLTINPDGVLDLHSGTSRLELDGDNAAATLTTQELLLSVRNTATITAVTLDLNATTANINATNITHTGNLIELDGGEIVTITCGGNSITVSKSTGIDIVAASGQYVKISNGTNTFPIVYSTNTASRNVLKLEELKTSAYITVGE